MASPSSNARQFASKFTSFIDKSPTPFHCVKSAIERLHENGFVRLDESVFWKGQVKAGGKYYYTRNSSSIVAFAVGEKFTAGSPFKVVGAHTDSPVLKVKPNSQRNPANGCIQIGAECYGGGLWHTWFDRDLGIAGRVIVSTGNGKFEQRLVHIEKPILRVPTLCIHLQTAEERKAFKVNKEDHLVPVLGLIEDTLNSTKGRHCPQILDILSKDLSCKPQDIVDLELTLCDCQPGSVGGANEDLVFAPRLDNQLHCFTSLEALSSYVEEGNLKDDASISLITLFDHEECGSQSATGAGSPIMRDAVHRISSCFMKEFDDETYKIGLSKSLLLSADGAHAVHPNYASKHEKYHSPLLGKGTVIKTNDNQRYATNAVTGFLVRELGRRNDIPIQEFVVRNDCPCGTTIGPIISANTGIRTVDIGAPQLSMHSIRETCAVEDLHSNYRLLLAFFKQGIEMDQSLSGVY